MILAAGRGERMMPLTERLPKPLLTVAGLTLIEHHLKRLAEAGIESVVINVHYLADQIAQHLGQERFGMPIEFSFESELLETAGGIQAALPLLGNEPFLVVNGDIFTDYDFTPLAGLGPVSYPHLVMVKNPPHHPEGDYIVGPNGVLEFASNHATGTAFTYAGMGLYPPQFFDGVQPGRMMLRPLFDTAVAAGQLTAEVFDGFWTDVGTPARYEALTLRFP